MLLRRSMLAALLASVGVLRAAELTDLTADGPAPVLWTAEGKGNRKVTLHVFLPKDHKASDQRAVTLWGLAPDGGTVTAHDRFLTQSGLLAGAATLRAAGP